MAGLTRKGVQTRVWQQKILFAGRVSSDIGGLYRIAIVEHLNEQTGSYRRRLPLFQAINGFKGYYQHFELG